MILRPDFEIMELSIVAGILYLYLIRNRIKTQEVKFNYIFALIWSAWTIVGVIIAITLIPQPPTSIPHPSPTPETVFRVYLSFVVFPQIIVLFLIVGDLTLYHVRKN